MQNISLDSPTLRYGIGCFETLKVFPEMVNGFKVAFLNEHIERLIYGASVCRLKCPPKAEIAQQVFSFLQNNASNRTLVLRLTLTEESGLHLAIQPYVERSQNIKMQISKDWFIESRSPLNKFKSFNYLKNHLAFMQAQQQGFDDAILLNETGQIAESSRANVFFLTCDNTWITPNLLSGCLPGIIRKVLISFLAAQEVQISPNDIVNFKSALAVNSLVEVQNIIQINETKLESLNLTEMKKEIHRKM